MASAKPVGAITRGTTNPNRLRRCDRWLVATHGRRLTRHHGIPVVVDLGYGASPVTALELHDRLRVVCPRVQVVGIEIDPARVAAAQPLARPGVEFVVGGFEIPLQDNTRPVVVRAFNVLRQYAEGDVPAMWDLVCGRLSAEGIFVDGTCDELGRLATWVTLDPGGPVSLTLSWRLRGLERPGVIAERLPKALIHRNVPGERVHDLIRDLDDQWARAAGQANYGVRQRFRAMAAGLQETGWPLLDGPARWRLGELTLDWSAVAPRVP